MTLPALNPRARERRLPTAPADDWFVTPPAVTLALLDREQLAPGIVWEPACGDGAMARVIEARGYEVYSTDLTWRGWGGEPRDFLAVDALPEGVQSVVTNPPFRLATQFALHALELGARKVALLCRLGFLEGQLRGDTIFADGRLSRVWVFSQRQTLWRGDAGAAPEGARGAMGFAWFVWERGDQGTRLGWVR